MTRQLSTNQAIYLIQLVKGQRSQTTHHKPSLIYIRLWLAEPFYLAAP